MAQLSIFLPPFSPDYSGASAVLFDLKTVTAMHDASGCTGNYTGFDDPRWYGSEAGIFCSGLREIDAIMGDDEKLENKMIAAAEYLKPDLLAIVGSPVPMVIGSDLDGIAVELENRTGLPAFGINTTGIGYYDEGALKIARQLVDRFTKDSPAGEKTSGRVNIIGALPMEFARGEELALFKDFLKEEGYEVNLSLAMGYTLEDLKHGARAEVNLAVSRFGLTMSRYLEEKFHIPYLAGFPVGEKGTLLWKAALEEVRKTRTSHILTPQDAERLGVLSDAAERSERVLIVGEQLRSNAIRIALMLDEGYRDVTVGCIYKEEEALSLPGDLNLLNEEEIMSALNDSAYDFIVADPFMEVLLDEGSDKKFIPYAQYAVSSKLGLKHKVNILHRDFHTWWETSK